MLAKVSKRKRNKTAFREQGSGTMLGSLLRSGRTFQLPGSRRARTSRHSRVGRGSRRASQDESTGGVQRSPHAMGVVKELARETADIPLEEGLQQEADGFFRCLGSDDGAEGVSAFIEKREPRWTGR